MPKDKPCYFCKRIIHTKGHKYRMIPTENKYKIRDTYYVCTKCDNIFQSFRSYPKRLKYLEIMFEGVEIYLEMQKSKGTRTIEEIANEIRINKDFAECDRLYGIK